MKKFLSLFLTIALIACLCACGTQPAQTQPSEQQPAQQPAAQGQTSAEYPFRPQMNKDISIDIPDFLKNRNR